MAEYIEREAALELVEPDARPFLAERIRAIPAADVVPVRRGKWESMGLDEPVDWFRCSECGHDVPWNAPYCEMCGAKMDGGET